MKVLTIGTDRKLFEEESTVLERVKEYARQVHEMHIIVFTKRDFVKKQFGNLFIYPTNSLSKFTYIFDAIRIGKKLENISVLSAQDPFESGLAGLLLKNKLRVPLQIQIHTDIFSPFFKNSFLNVIRLHMSKIIIPKADGIRVVSEKIKKEIYKIFPKLKTPIDVLPVFVDVREIMEKTPLRNLKEDFPQFENIILMASRLTQEKRIDIALQAFSKVIKKFPKTGLIIAGQGQKEKYLRNIVHSLSMENQVYFIGWQNDLISLYKTADIFLLTSEYEGYGLTLIEAAAAGCPVVTTKVGIADSELFENAGVCPVGDVDCLADCLLEFLSNPEKVELLKSKMQDSMKQMPTKEQYVEQYISLLSKLT